MKMRLSNSDYWDLFLCYDCTDEQDNNQILDDCILVDIDINNDTPKKNLKNLTKNCNLTSNLNEIKQCNVYIITVPTPINDDKTPDLKPLISSSELVGSIIKKGSVVIYESTVYPGVTD